MCIRDRLSSKHTPKDNPDEKQRVIDAGGRVVHGGRVGHPRFNPNVLHVALSRAMGDAPFKLPELTLSKPSGIIATPDTLSLIHISEPTRLLSISYAVFCLKKKKQNIMTYT
eukprot:TRINITY_DN46778_c0_g1_i1.p1 TRINITY_DN46778_c0_g1~~TRINITY_DN46778_c0_g1_i1.p1  ORF type:complete len:112 (+),score=31.98 TRINITY_DN46778_c0_g1_i1:162-497(+)